jgi:hypothetical protein
MYLINEIEVKKNLRNANQTKEYRDKHEEKKGMTAMKTTTV